MSSRYDDVRAFINKEVKADKSLIDETGIEFYVRMQSIKWREALGSSLNSDYWSRMDKIYRHAYLHVQAVEELERRIAKEKAFDDMFKHTEYLMNNKEIIQKPSYRLGILAKVASHNTNTLLKLRNSKFK